MLESPEFNRADALRRLNATLTNRPNDGRARPPSGLGAHGSNRLHRLLAIFASDVKVGNQPHQRLPHGAGNHILLSELLQKSR